MSAVGVGVGIARALAIGRAGVKLGQVLGNVGEQLAESLNDKSLTPNQVEHLAIQALRNEDFRCTVRGRDIIDPETQDHLIRASARMIGNIVTAIREG